MRSFTFNENIMCALINTGYLKSALIIRGDASVYPRFLVRLLQRNGKTKHTRNSPKLQHTICKQLYNISIKTSEQSSRLSKKDVLTITSNDDININIIVPLLVRLLQHKDENIHVLSIASLVNYTYVQNQIIEKLNYALY